MKLVVLGSVLILAASCSKSSTKDAAPAADGSESGVATTNVGKLQLSELNLTGSLSPDLPASLQTESASGLHLAATSQSAEACLLRQSVSELKMNTSMVAMQLCMLEATPGMDWGGKYNIDFGAMALTPTPPEGMEIPEGAPDSSAPEGAPDNGAPDMDQSAMPSNMQVFLDNTVEGKFTVYVCQDKTLTQVIKVDKAIAEKGAAGNYTINMDGMQLVGTFDNGVSTEGRYKATAQMKFKFGEFSANSSVAMDLALEEGGIHTVSAARETGASFEDLATTDKVLIAGRMGPEFGAAVVQNSGSNSMFAEEGASLLAGAFETSRAYFTAAGAVAALGDSTQFEEGGDLYIDAGTLPKLLDDFEVAPTGWDCSGTTDLEMTAPASGEDNAMNACMDDMFSSMDPGCFGGDFAPGETIEVDSQFDERAPIDNFEE